jgi:hypothetical protein
MMQPSSTEKSTDPAVETELDQLATTPIAGLRIRYRELFRTEPPKAFGPDLLRRSIAQRIQERVYGGLSRSTRQLLGQLIKAYAAKPNGRIELPRRIKPGSVLVREWKKKSYRVTVLAEGFAYEGATYSNLSEIAFLISGTKWNGPRFFGLRSKTPIESNTVATAKETHRCKSAAGIASNERHTKSAAMRGRHGG